MNEELEKAIKESQEIFERMVKFFKEMEEIHAKYNPITISE